MKRILKLSCFVLLTSTLACAAYADQTELKACPASKAYWAACCYDAEALTSSKNKELKISCNAYNEDYVTKVATSCKDLGNTWYRFVEINGKQTSFSCKSVGDGSSPGMCQCTLGVAGAKTTNAICQTMADKKWIWQYYYDNPSQKLTLTCQAKQS